MSRACVFAHFDLDGELAEHVLYYLKCLNVVVDKIKFVTTSLLAEKDLHKLDSMKIDVIQRENYGYDFYSYKVGISQLQLDEYDELLLCNDSVYGPFNDLGKLFDQMKERDAAFWGVTENFEFSHHIQSYFIMFSTPVLQSKVFQEFWASLEVLSDKKKVIRRYEVGLTQCLLQQGFHLDVVATLDRPGNFHRIILSWRQYLQIFRRRWREPRLYLDILKIMFLGGKLGVNPTHMEWKSLLVNHHVPFIKIELLRDNPKGIDDLNTVFETIASCSNYPLTLISDHIERVKGRY